MPFIDPSMNLYLQLLLLAVSGWINRRQQSVTEYVQAENRALRQQLGPKRIRWTDAQRRLLTEKARAVGLAALAGLGWETMALTRSGKPMAYKPAGVRALTGTSVDDKVRARVNSAGVLPQRWDRISAWQRRRCRFLRALYLPKLALAQDRRKLLRWERPEEVAGWILGAEGGSTVDRVLVGVRCRWRDCVI